MALAAEIKDGVYKIEKCADICIDIYEKKELYLKKIESAVASISPDNSKLPCSVFINNGRVRKLFGDYGILKSSDFMNRNPKIILVLSCLHCNILYKSYNGFILIKKHFLILIQ